MKLINLITILFLLSFPMLSGCKNPVTSETDTLINGQRVISFSGYEWAVAKAPKNQGAGPFLYSDSKENVWLDKDGKLHLRITYRDGKWYCAKVTLMKSYSYGRYVFQIDSRVDNFDKMWLVVCLFIKTIRRKSILNSQNGASMETWMHSTPFNPAAKVKTREGFF